MSFGYAVYFTERGKDRVVRWEPDSGAVEIVAGEPSNGDPNQKLEHPYGLAFDSGGSLLIADKARHRICRLKNGSLLPLRLTDPKGTRKRLSDSPLQYDPRLICPTALFMEEGGSFLCTFADDCTIYRIHQDLSLEHLLGVLPNRKYFFFDYPETVLPWHVADTPINAPTGIVKRKDGTIYFIERKPQLVRAYHPSLGLRSVFPHRVLGEFRRPLEAPDQAPISAYRPPYPGSLAVDKDDFLYVTEARHSCVLRIDLANGIVRKVVKTGQPTLHGEVGIAALGFGPDGTAWILNRASQAVEAYEPTTTGLWRSRNVRLTEVNGQPLRLPTAGSGLAFGN